MGNLLFVLFTRKCEEKAYFLYKNGSFDIKSVFYDFLTSINNEQYWFTLPMVDWIGENNLKNIDYIGKFETIDEDIHQINKKLTLS